ncbi:AAWKG family protein [Streptomyces mirabilis]|uniref:AAWKG family protein n=1 Tax=Streptomyces mirabilis TaxID=68239 RepID=A0ABU3V5D6_9ACTN|nr:AAWKG family protein [Streptomyces mirabilis]MCX5355744.1 AAWKG family protein [Streptomyces mirabilis]MDU9001387.1 AAWKG family protein [Streptomyces mirabilis]
MAIDNWEDIIKLLTGWTLPGRSEVTGVKGDSGTPWINVKIKKEKHRSTTPQIRLDPGYGATFQYFVQHGKSVDMYTAQINYLGDLAKGTTYWERSREALNRLVTQFQSSGEPSAYGGDPGLTDAVDLRSFNKTAYSFDRAGQFFRNRTAVLKNWLDALGADNAAWKGTAADVFRDLIDDLHNKYDHYTTQLRPPGFTPANTSVVTGTQAWTLHGDNLIGAQNDLHRAYTDLSRQLDDFYWRRGRGVNVTSADGTTSSHVPPAEPTSILDELMWDIQWFIRQYNHANVAYTTTTSTTSNGTRQTSTSWHPQPGFSANTAWGNLKDQSSWSGLAQEAINRWTNNLQANLDEPAHRTATDLGVKWTQVLDSGRDTRFAFEDIPSVSLADKLAKEQAEKAQEDAQRQAEEAAKESQQQADKFTKGITGLTSEGSPVGSTYSSGDPLSGQTFHVGATDVGIPSSSTDGLTDTATPSSSAFVSGLPTVGGPQAFSTDSATGTPATLAANGANPHSLLSGLPSATDISTGTPSTADFSAGVPSATDISTGAPSAADFSAGVPSATDISTGTPSTAGVPAVPDLSTLLSSPATVGTSELTGPDAGVSSTSETGTPLSIPSLTDLSPVTPTTGPVKTNSDGSTTAATAGGGLVTHFPDGSSVAVAPDGTVTTTSDNGVTTTSTLQPGQVLTNPDGSTISLSPDGGVTTHLTDGSSYTSHPDGSVTTTNPDGTSTTQFPNGVTETVGPDGQTHFTNPDGSVTTQNPDGTVSTDFPDGSTATVDPRTGTVTTLTPDGQTISTHLDPGQSLVNPDGSTTTIGPDGSVTTALPGGGTYTLHPDGTVTTTNPDGTALTPPDGTATTLPDGTVTQLPEPAGLPTVSGGPGTLTTLTPDGATTVHYPSGTTATTGADGFTTTSFPDGSSTVSGPGGQFQTLPSPDTTGLLDGSAGLTDGSADPAQAGAFGGLGGGAGQAATAAAGQGADPGLSGLLSPMMMMSGMGRMGQGQQNKEQERIREVYGDDESDGAFFHTQQVGRPGSQPDPEPDLYEEEEEDSEELLSRPGRDQGAGYARPSTQSASGRLDDGGDVWGTEEGGLPASIGR